MRLTEAIGYLICLLFFIIACMVIPTVYSNALGIPKEYVTPKTFWRTFTVFAARERDGCIIDEIYYKLNK